MTKTYYFDYAAATPVDKDVIKSMEPYWSDRFYNSSAVYLASKKVAQDLARARASVANLLGAKSPEIIFTAGGTESDNLAIKGVMDLHPKGHLIVSAVEHDAVLEAAKIYDHSLVPVDEQGRIDLEKLKNLIKPNTVLISAMHANNETGVIQPINQIANIKSEAIRSRSTNNNSTPLYLHTDASQSANYLDIKVNRLGVDMMTLNGGKIYGPKQTGVLFVGTHVRLRAQQLGGGQERGLRSGTENVAGIIGFACALEKAQQLREVEADRLEKLKSKFVTMVSQKISGVVINSEVNIQRFLPNFVHLTIPGVDNERLVMELDEVGVMCAVGSACSASSDEPSHVLTAIGLSEADIRSSVRFTMGRVTTLESVEYVIERLAQLCK